MISVVLSLYSPDLHTLKILNGTSRITEKSIENIFAGCRKLKYIQISEPHNSTFVNPFDGALASISKYCKELEVLKLNNWAHIDSIACLSELTNLRELDLEMVTGWPNSPDEIFASNSLLEKVCLSGNLSHDIILRGLGAHCRTLKHVEITAWLPRVLTNDGIRVLVQGCPLLETIHISTFNSASAFEGESDVFVPTVPVTNAAMYAIAQHCPHLKMFKINSPDPLAYDNTGLDAIKLSCPHLQAIYKDRKVYYAAHGYVTSDHPYQIYDPDYGWYFATFTNSFMYKADGLDQA